MILDFMMQYIHINTPVWQNTLPCRVTPFPDEWLAGLLLRCDEINHWACRTTLAHLLSLGPEKFHRCWRTENPNLIVIQSNSLNLNYLAQVLHVSVSDLFATTYHRELARLYEETRPHPKLLRASFSFHLCPQCIAENRLLLRLLTLPQIAVCPRHRVFLQNVCQCGATLQLFSMRSLPPFTCHQCGGDWATLPVIEATSECFTREQEYLSWYEFFFSNGTPLIFQQAMLLANGVPAEQIQTKLQLRKSKVRHHRLVGEPFPLGALVPLLVKRNLFPSHLINLSSHDTRLQTPDEIWG
jgi:hypothetical protein